MSNYIIKVQLADGNPEFAPDKQLITGIEIDGFLLMTMRKNKPHAVIINNMTIHDIARMIAGDETKAGTVIRQAIAVAEGLQKAANIEKEENKMRMARELVEMLQEKN